MFRQELRAVTLGAKGHRKAVSVAAAGCTGADPGHLTERQSWTELLLSRGNLESFLDRIAEGAEQACILAPKAPAPRRSLRELIQTDSIPATLETAPQNLTFDNGRLTIQFASMAELDGSLLALAEILSDQDEFAEFERRYMPARPQLADPDEGHAEMERLFAELSDLGHWKPHTYVIPDDHQLQIPHTS